MVALATIQVVDWLTATPEVGPFRSSGDQLAYRSAYDEALAIMPTPTRVHHVTTSFGVVRAYEWAAPDATGAPVALLPGRGSGVPMWSENLPRLLEGRILYAFDALGDAGLSAQTAPLVSVADQAQWDRRDAGGARHRARPRGGALLRGCERDGAGGAPPRPGRHLDPARARLRPGLAPASVLGWPAVASLPFLPQGWRDAAVARIAGEDPAGVTSDDPVARMITRGATGYSATLPTPTPPSDDDLRGLAMPVYVALADGSPITGGTASLARAELLPHAQVRVWPDTTHSLPMQVADPLAAELHPFWGAHDG